MEELEVTTGCGLSAEFVQRVFPIAPSDRRENSDLFSPRITPAALKDDARFYTALADMLKADLGPIREYDRRMCSRKSGKKCFAVRALRFLHQQVADELSLQEIEDLPAEYFLPGSSNRAVHDFYRNLTRAEDEIPSGFDDMHATEPRSDWQALAAEIAARAGAMAAPDVSEAAIVLDLAAALKSACASAQEIAARAELLTQRRRALAEQLSPFADDLGEAMLDALANADEALLDRLEAIAPELDAARLRADQVATEYDELRARKADADRDEDWDRSAELIAALRAAKESRDAARQEYSDRLSDVRSAVCAPEQSNELDPGSAAADPESLAPIRPDAQPEPAPAAPETVAIELRVEPPGATGSSEDVRHDDSAEAEESGRAIAADSPGIGAPSDSDQLADEPVARGPVQDLDNLLATYLDRGDAALAWHLAELAEERGQEPGVPSAVLKALAVAPAFLRPADIADARKQEILADSMAAVTAAEQSGDERKADRARTLAFAALLQPALFDMGQIGRPHLKMLSMTGSLAPLARLGEALSDLGYDVQLSSEDLVELSGTERQRRLPAAISALRDWLCSARVAKTVHQPTYRILHWLLDPGGTLGRAFEAAIADAPHAVKEVSNLIARLLDDRAGQERFVAESEKANGRPRRDRIEGMALTWFCDKLQEGCELLRDWLDAKEADATLVDDRRRASLKARIGQLRNLIEPFLQPDDMTGQGLDGAVQAALGRALAAFGALLDGQGPIGTSPRVRELLSAPLVHLPGGCQPRAGEGAAFAAERARQRDRLFAALQAPERLTRDAARAFEVRLSEGAMIAARDALDAMRRGGTAADALDRSGQRLDDAVAEHRARQRERLERLRLDLSTLLNLDLGTPDKVREQLDRIEIMSNALTASAEAEAVKLPAFDGLRDPQVPPDFPELAVELAELESFRGTLRSRIRSEQRTRLKELSRRQECAAQARVLLARIDSLDPVTLDDMIAQVQAGSSVAALDDDTGDGFTAFFPDFVASLAEASETNRGRIIAAIDRRARVDPMDFTSHDETTASLAKRLIETWAECDNALRSNAPDKLRQALAKLLGLIGFTGVKLGGDRELIPGRLRSVRMACDVPEAERWFLPPMFGSEAQGHYPVMLARPELQEEQLSTELGKIGRDRPCLLFLFGRLNRRRREDLARVLRRDRQTVLPIDEALLLHLAATGGNPMDHLFTCAAPFGWVQPYTTNPRSIPPEMFFGRRDEIARIVSRQSGGCLVYGGRQLGKSALLTHISRRYHRPGDGQQAIYLDIAPIGDGGTPPEAVWREIAGRLTGTGILADPVPERDGVVAALRRWLDGAPERRVLIMLDEADRFLKSEHAAGYPNLRRMKDLMEATAWRFKVVFAGLHNVRRMSQAPNSPLVHLGDPICIGPLNTTQENQAEARRLVCAPMRAAGYDYDPPALAWDILARVNHYPSLVQVFCKALIEMAGNQPRPAGTGPRWALKREMLFEGRTAEAIAAEIRKRFQWSLDLDPRYDLIAKTLALHRLDDVDGNATVLREGLPADEIARLVDPWWPKGMERLRQADFQAILGEMVDLGVLGRPSLGRYGLRNAHVAQMLGQREEIETEIIAISEREPEVDYDAAFFHRRVQLSDADRRAPLADRVLDELFDASVPGLRVLAAAPALWGQDLGFRLRQLAESWTEAGQAVTALLHTGPKSELRTLIERHRREQLIIVTETEWDRAAASWLARQRGVVSGAVIPIWVVPPDWTLRHLYAPSDNPPLHLFHPQPWGETMLRHWLKDQGLGALDDRETRTSILSVSGGVPERLSALRGLLQQIVADRTKGRCERLSGWLAANPLTAESAGLDLDLLDRFRDFAVLAESDDLAHDDVQTVLGESGEVLGSFFAALGLAELLPGGGLRLSPLGRIITR